MSTSPFLDIQEAPIIDNTGKIAGAPYLDNTESIGMGAGTTGFRAVKGKGIWLGAKDFADAPFSVDMHGNIYGSSATFPNLITISIFKQPGIPTSLAIGDLWFDTDDNNKLYRAGSVGADAITTGEWEAVSSTGVSIFAQTSIPTSITAGDLWYDTDDNNKVYRAASAGATTIASGQWELLNDLRAADAILKAGSSQTLTGDILVGASGVKIDGANTRIVINDGTTNRGVFGNV